MATEYEGLIAWAKKLDVQNVFELSKNTVLSGPHKANAYRCAKLLEFRNEPSFRQLRLLKKSFEAAESASDATGVSSVDELTYVAGEEVLDADIRHLCLRIAWHDNKWDGNICRDPASNIYCIGERSLLSDRIRTRRNVDIESRPGCAGCKSDAATLGEYQPPCFWSINAFGQHDLKFVHDNPVASDFPSIGQELAPYSVISWPFNLSFVRDAAEKKKYSGNYYPEDIFENRIKLFQQKVKPAQSIVFTYCNYSNPVSGEDSKFLVVGCALLANQGKPKYFDISDEQLAETAQKVRQPNFPKMNWALRYTLDFENTGVRIPYHEYLEKIEYGGAITDAELQEIAVTIDETELRDGFTYVAKHVDDDQAIYLLLKMRRSLLKVLEHGFVDSSFVEAQLQLLEDLIAETWDKRGYLPGVNNLLRSIPGIKENYHKDLAQLMRSSDFTDADTVLTMREALDDGSGPLAESYPGIVAEAREFMQHNGLSGLDVLRLSGLNLTENQFRRISNRRGIGSSLKEVCENPYVLHEDYSPGDEIEDRLSGQKIDGFVDLFRIDVSLLPLAKYQAKIPDIHTWTADDRRRLRAVVIQILKDRENAGDCFLEANEIVDFAAAYSLFYRTDTPYKIGDTLFSPSDETTRHLSEKLVRVEETNKSFYYLKSLYDDEVFVRTTIQDLVGKKDRGSSTAALSTDIENAVGLLTAKIGDRFQAEAFREEREHLYRNVGDKAFFVLTGAPGAGKSFELLKIIDFLNRQRELNIVLAPTGKAVIRLKSNEEGITSVNALTIDKFLVDQRNTASQSGTRIINNLVIDEASMVDLPKFAEVLRSIDLTHLKRLILVGDPNQLPPIGFGKPFVDTVDMMVQDPAKFSRNIATLEVNCRAEMSEEYIEFTKVFSNESKLAESYLSQTSKAGQIFGDVEMVVWESKEELLEKLRDRVELLLEDEGLGEDELPRLLGITSPGERPKSLDRFQVLSPYRSAYFGASGLNLFFQDVLRAKEPLAHSSGEVVFKLFDKVMHTQNEYRENRLWVSNGSLGAVVGNNKVFFTDVEKPVSIGSLRNRDMLELAYAITVHKAQGSGFGAVFIVLPAKARYTSRELLYTALTRARNQVKIFVQQGEDIAEVPQFLGQIRLRSAVVERRTSLFAKEGQLYAYTPGTDVVVKSRVEYIIYRKLLEAKQRGGDFSFEYEQVYELKGEKFDIHPDFVIDFSDGRRIYWEHLGRVNSRSYMSDWDKRKSLYEAQSDFDRVLTTDELNGISDEKIEKIVADLQANRLETEDKSDRYSRMHFSLS